MNVGIICEYNPFHNGHKYQIDTVKEKYPGCAVIALMSGNFTQRGEPALLPKRARARAALLCGADAVLELPVVYSMAPAQFFAAAGVRVLTALGADLLCFGSERGDTGALALAANRLLSDKFEELFKQSLAERRGEGYAALLYATYASLWPGADILRGSNDILAIEYIKEIIRQGSPLRPEALARAGGGAGRIPLSDLLYASASNIREAALRMRAPEELRALSHVMPPESLAILKDCARVGALARIGNLENSIISHLRRLSPGELRAYPDINGGLEYRIAEAARKSATLEQFYAAAAAKNYTSSRIRRAVMHAFLDISAPLREERPRFARLLAANGRGCAFLASARKRGELPVITKPASAKRLRASDPALARQFEACLFADGIYNLALDNKAAGADEMRAGPVIQIEN